jgi:transcriptional regulator with XRE-family HTH domain
MTNLSDIDREIGWRLRIKKISQGFDKKTLAQRLAATEQDVHAWEMGHKRIDAHSMSLLCKVLNVDAAYFFGAWTQEANTDFMAYSAAAE